MKLRHILVFLMLLSALAPVMLYSYVHLEAYAPIATSRSQACPHLNHFDQFKTMDEVLDAYTAFHQCCIRNPSHETRYLVYHPQNGLGNRLRGMLSTLLYAVMSRRVILLEWSKEHNCNADWSDLFDPAPIDWVSGVYSKTTNLAMWFDDAYSRWRRGQDTSEDMNFILHGNLSQGGSRVEVFSTYTNFIGELMDNDVICHQYGPDSLYHVFENMTSSSMAKNLAKYLISPHKHLVDSVQDVLSTLPQPIVGIHMRESFTNAGAHRHWVKTALAFRDRLSRVPSYLVSTDNCESEKALLDALANETVSACPRFTATCVSKIERSTKEGIQQSLIAMLLLNNADVLVGTFVSSFSAMSRVLPLYKDLHYRNEHITSLPDECSSYYMLNCFL